MYIEKGDVEDWITEMLKKPEVYASDSKKEKKITVKIGGAVNIFTVHHKSKIIYEGADIDKAIELYNEIKW